MPVVGRHDYVLAVSQFSRCAVYCYTCRRCHGLKPVSQLSSLLLFDPLSDKALLRGWNMLRCVLLCGKEGAQQLLDQGLQHAELLDSTGRLNALHPYRKSQQDLAAMDSPAVAGTADSVEGIVQSDAAADATTASPVVSPSSSSSCSSEGVSVASRELGCVPGGEGAGSSGDSMCSVCSEGLADVVAVIEAECGSPKRVSDEN